MSKPMDVIEKAVHDIQVALTTKGNAFNRNEFEFMIRIFTLFAENCKKTLEKGKPV